MSEPFEHMVAAGDPLDIPSHPHCSNCLARIMIAMDRPKEIFLSDFLKLETQVASAYRQAIDEKLKQQLRFLFDGELPSPEEFAKNGKRLTWPDGRVEYYWGTTLILSEKPLFQHL